MPITVAGLLVAAFALGRWHGRGELRRREGEVEPTPEILAFEGRVRLWE